MSPALSAGVLELGGVYRGWGKDLSFPGQFKTSLIVESVLVSMCGFLCIEQSHKTALVIFAVEI